MLAFRCRFSNAGDSGNRQDLGHGMSFGMTSWYAEGATFLPLEEYL